MMGSVPVLLSETELRAALEPLLDRLLTERLHLFRLQLEPRLQSLIAAALQPRALASAQEDLLRLLRSPDPNHCFALLFQQARELVGPARALIVVHRNQAAVWQREGVELPERFPLASQDLVLRAGQRLPIRVRGRLVGLLHWPGAALEAAAQARLDLLLQLAGLVLLGQALPRDQAAGAPAATTLVAAPEPPSSAPTAAPTPRTPRSDEEARAQRFAALLIEDLALYLRRERPQDLAQGRACGDWRHRFQPELERCQRAFLDRYPPGGGIEASLLEEALPRLLAS